MLGQRSLEHLPRDAFSARIAAEGHNLLLVGWRKSLVRCEREGANKGLWYTQHPEQGWDGHPNPAGAEARAGRCVMQSWGSRARSHWYLCSSFVLLIL